MDFRVITPEMLSNEYLLRVSAMELSIRGFTEEERKLLRRFQKLLQERRKQFVEAEAELEATQRKLRDHRERQLSLRSTADTSNPRTEIVLLENETRIMQQIRDLRDHYDQLLSEFDVRFDPLRDKIAELLS